MAGGEGSRSGSPLGCDGPLQGPPAIGSVNVDPGRVDRAQDPSDELLLQAVARGDRDALGALYDRCAGEMWAVALRFLGGAREAEDLVHDVFLEAWHRARHYDRTRGSVRTWLMLRLRSRALDWLRSARRNVLVGFEETKVDPAAIAEPDVAWRGDRELHGGLADLPREQRIVLELAYFAGYSHAEIALRLEIPLGTVKSRMTRAILALRSRLNPSEEQPCARPRRRSNARTPRTLGAFALRTGEDRAERLPDRRPGPR
jgi:RNA polymerase sigma-70 factor (ECF subfamily)